MKTETSTTQEPALAGPDPETGRPGDREKKNGHALPARGPVVRIGNLTDGKAALDAFLGSQRAIASERRAAADAARDALVRLCHAMRLRTGQSATVRALLYSLWNGQPASLLDLVTLDWDLRKDLCAVLLAFGFEPLNDPAAAFYYDAVKNAIVQHGLWDWFLEACEESEVAK